MVLIWAKRIIKSLCKYQQGGEKPGELQLCEQHGIEFVETKYTSQASFLAHDFLPRFGEKPEGWEPSGKLLKGGLYCSATGQIIFMWRGGSMLMK